MGIARELMIFRTSRWVQLVKYYFVTPVKNLYVLYTVSVSEHISTAKHKANVTRKNKIKQQLFCNAIASGSKSATISKELCYAMICVDIPLGKLNNPFFKNLIVNYSGKRIPDESNLRKKCGSTVFTRIIWRLFEKKI